MPKLLSIFYYQKSKLESSLSLLKEAHQAKDLEKIDSSIASLNEVWSEVSTEIYKNAETDSKTNENTNDNIEDVNFEEVTDID